MKSRGQRIADLIDAIAVWRARGLQADAEDFQWQAQCRENAEQAKRELAEELEGS